MSNVYLCYIKHLSMHREFRRFIIFLSLFLNTEKEEGDKSQSKRHQWYYEVMFLLNAGKPTEVRNVKLMVRCTCRLGKVDSRIDQRSEE